MGRRLCIAGKERRSLFRRAAMTACSAQGMQRDARQSGEANRDASKATMRRGGVPDHPNSRLPSQCRLYSDGDGGGRKGEEGGRWSRYKQLGRQRGLCVGRARARASALRRVAIVQ
eukprot:scaffold7504_cov121-Isochrysis_galbana.AAC.5